MAEHSPLMLVFLGQIFSPTLKLSPRSLTGSRRLNEVSALFRYLTLTFIVTVKQFVIRDSCTVRIAPPVSVFIPIVFVVKPNELFSGNSTLHPLTLGCIRHHQVKRTYHGKGEGRQFVTICSAAVFNQGISVIFAIRKCPSFFVDVLVVFVIPIDISFLESFRTVRVLIYAVLTCNNIINNDTENKELKK